MPTTEAPIAATARVSAGCTIGTELAPGEEMVPFATDELEGTIIRTVPSSYDGVTPTPVVIGLHGWSQPAALLGAQSALAAAGERDGLVVLLPSISREVPLWDTALDSADVAWFGAMLDEVAASMCVDTDQIFVTGMSNGAMMTSTVACRFADQIAAVATVAGIRLPDGCDPARPVPIIAFHGTDDQFLAYEGGFGPAVGGLSAPDGDGNLGGVEASGPDAASVPARIAGWSALNGCADLLAETSVADDVDVLAAEECDAPVVLYTIDGGGHTWPGSEFDQSIEAIVGPTTTSVDATELILTFFTSVGA